MRKSKKSDIFIKASLRLGIMKIKTLDLGGLRKILQTPELPPGLPALFTLVEQATFSNDGNQLIYTY